MKFSDLYKDNKKAVRDTFITMWCSNTRNEVQSKYAEQIRLLINGELFSSEKFMPLVQCMDRYESVHSVSDEEAKALVGDLWNKSYSPYEHQYQAWKALSNTDGPKQSMVVTTGTGSGKTECFMLPLVHDLVQNAQQHQIEAIFLYPLNALMEDQKERLQELLDKTNLKFAVYNGNLPNEDKGENTADQFEKMQHDRISKEQIQYPNIIPTRKEMYQTRPNIILTNPTMLEYMLLRKKDQDLFTPKSLKWIVIDETHTFSGAGAAELAMLIRRVLDAFDVEAKDIRFATSSATIGNATNEEQQQRNDEELRKFISDISGVPMDQVKLISGIRNHMGKSANQEVERCRKLLSENDYVRLDVMFPEGDIEQKLMALDALCEMETEPLKAKVHFFYRVPNNGLRIQLDDSKDGVFNIKSTIPIDANETPFLELFRCEHCGEYLAVAETVPNSAHKYRAMTQSASDIFEFDTIQAKSDKMLLALTNKEPSEQDGNIYLRIDRDEYFVEDIKVPNGWNIVNNTKKSCPHCQVRIIGKDNDKDNKDDQEDTSEEIAEKATNFRMPAAFISRILAPSILPQLRKSKGGNPHDGQQYISFVDSRQGAARATMQQNIEQERLWVYSRVFNELSRRKKEGEVWQVIQDELIRIDRKLDEFLKDGNREGYFDLSLKQAELKIKCNGLVAMPKAMTWKDIYEFLDGMPESDQLCYQFINKGERSQEVDSNGEVSSDAKAKYIQSVMIELLSKRPRKASAPETMGLFTSCYPKLEEINKLPEAVVTFNEEFLEGKKQIDIAEWKNLIKIFMDNVVRSNQSVYLKISGLDLDITGCQRFGTTKSPRRPVHKPHIKEERSGSYATSVLLLAKLIEPQSLNLNLTAYTNRAKINEILNAMWIELTENTKLIQPSEKLRNGIWDFDRDKDETQGLQYRLNVTDLSFKIFETAWLCDSRMRGEHYEVLRPIDTLFMGYSPYPVNGNIVEPKLDSSNWEYYPYLDGFKDGNPVKYSDIKEWAKCKRSLLWENGIWGEVGSFASRLNIIYSYPKIFIQAEHTAQVDKLISRQSQEKFKNQEINILACSTTMEMGVDLGNLELVMMSSIPPHPSNYKQRAGRSGRNDDTRSACITLCGSDAVGFRTLVSPMEQLIKRPMAVPFVDMNSPQVIQRHVNAFLLRNSGIFLRNHHGNANNLDQEIIEFFTPYAFDINNKNRYFSIKDSTGALIYPNSLLGDSESTKFHLFKTYLNGDTITFGRNYIELESSRDRLKKLLMNTCFNGEIDETIYRCKADIERCYEELLTVVSDIAETYEEEREKLINSNKVKDQEFVLGNEVNSGYGHFLRHKYAECLSKNMLSYLATNRFTPNANMPVQIIEFEQDLKHKSSDNYSFRKCNNPSYVLQDAIAQYAPGNTIVLENRTSVVRGVLYTGIYKKVNTFKKIYSDGNNTVIDSEKRLKGKAKLWAVNGRSDLMLVEPVSFVPDIHEDCSRIIEKNSYTQVSAQLIGADEWSDLDDPISLIATRNNKESGEAKILYYNEGVGYGYAFCRDCGKSVIENSIAKKFSNLPDGMQNEFKDKDGKLSYFHYNIHRLNKNKRPIECGYYSNIKRNVIFGGVIQADYCEIKIRMDKHGDWLNQRDEQANRFLITLGVIITKNFAEYIGKDRKDIDFSVMPNGHLCIFDTNPGGSGYSSQLTNPRIIQEVLRLSQSRLAEIVSKDALLDKFTIRYLEKLDVKAVQVWLDLVIASFQDVPAPIKESYPDVSVALIENIFEDFKSISNKSDSILFVNSHWNKWLYQTDDTSNLGWKQRIMDIRKSLGDIKVQVCVVDSGNIPLPIYSMMQRMSDWANLTTCANFLKGGLIPVAKVGNQLYFTNQSSCAELNYGWAKSGLYRTNISEMVSVKDIDLSKIPSGSKKFILGMETHDRNTSTRRLGELVEPEIKDLLNQFIAHINQYEGGNLRVVYQDEHLKSVLGMVASIQFIEYYVQKIGKPFSLEFVLEEYSEIRNCNTISQNISHSSDRDEMLFQIGDQWKDEIEEEGMACQSFNIDTRSGKNLPHWRELRFEFEGKQLILYPNGGIINEWFLDGSRTTKRYQISNTTITDEIPLYRKKDIMYDAVYRDVN